MLRKSSSSERRVVLGIARDFFIVHARLVFLSTSFCRSGAEIENMSSLFFVCCVEVKGAKKRENFIGDNKFPIIKHFSLAVFRPYWGVRDSKSSSTANDRECSFFYSVSSNLRDGWWGGGRENSKEKMLSWSRGGMRWVKNKRRKNTVELAVEWNDEKWKQFFPFKFSISTVLYNGEDNFYEK